jgi:heme-degrading monooxygenase HmoA
MAQISEKKRVVTQINVIDVEPGKEDELVALIKDRIGFMADQPGFVSASLHRSVDGGRVVNYVQWRDADSLRAAHHTPEFRAKWPKFGQLTTDADPVLYELVHAEG